MQGVWVKIMLIFQTVFKGFIHVTNQVVVDRAMLGIKLYAISGIDR